MFRLPVYYLIVVFGMYFFQNYFIYHPDKTDLNLIEQTARAHGLQLWPQEADGYYGFVSQTAPQKAKGTILVFHGNAGKALDRTYYVRAFDRLGYRVLLIEYPGYGARRGKPGEKQFVEDAIESTRLANKEFGRPLFILGESLGCGIVCGVVAKSNVSIDGVSLITPWDSLSNLAQAKYWFLPARWMVKDKYDNVANLAHYLGPVAVVMAGQDEIIPTRLTLRLYESIRSPKRLWTFPNAGHNSWPSGSTESWWSEMMRFLDSSAGN
jgi:alpha-beta hydrolase superfamily lysophospholipase